MNIKRTWVVVGASIGIAGFAGAGIAMASDDVDLQDPKHAPVVQLTGDSANSPNAPGPGASADSAADSPGEAGYAGPGAGGSADSAADSPGEAVAPPPPPAKQAPAPAPAPAKVASADSPAPAPVRPRVHSGDSGNSGSSAGSAGSAD